MSGGVRLATEAQEARLGNGRGFLRRFNRLSPQQVLVIGFAALIVVGGLLLSLPVASRRGDRLPFADALFTSTSAVCVTGLVVVDTHDQFSLFGQLVIICLIQIGGLGIMTISTLVFLILGKRVTLRGRILIQEAMNQLTLEGMVRLIKKVIVVTVVVEGIGAILLALRWSGEMSFPKAAYYGLFHAVSAFCNAGFDLFGGFKSLSMYRNDIGINLIITGLIIIGGLGFTVVTELLENPFSPKRSLHTKLVIRATLSLIAVGTVIVFLLEAKNPNTLGSLGVGEKVIGSYFQAVTARTAGFSTIPSGNLRPATLFFLVILMFIGASPGSTGGGIKTTTFITLFLAVLSVIKGRDDVEIYERRIPKRLVDRALAVSMISLTMVVAITMVLSSVQKFEFLEVLFETVSAFGTVGLSTGITPHLALPGKILIMLTMFSGRLGPLTVAAAIAQKQHIVQVRYPEEKIMVG
ncbi:MAG: Trk family potassium uptake protein [Firmicutes bacterium]|nr:Trk family potassium uptake protein [Bacillota bacterium]